MPNFLQYLLSFVSERKVDARDSEVSPELSVEYAYGKYMLNSTSVNYSFGNLGRAFRIAFDKLNVQARKYDEVLLLGLGVGNVPHLLREYGKPFRMTGIELDPAVIDLGKKWFGLGEYEGLDIVQADACGWLAVNEAQFDLVVVDLFVDDQVPECAESPDFLRGLEKALRPGGLLVCNRLEFRPDLADATREFFRKMQQILPGTRSVKVPENLMLIYEKPA